jgi:hypothetical protein
MRKFTNYLPILIGLSLFTLGAVYPIETQQVNRDTAEITNVALTAAAGSRTFSIPTKGYSQATVYIDYNRGGTGAATTITMSCLAGPTGDINYKVASLEQTATAHTSQAGQHTWSWAVSASDEIRFIVTPLNDDYLSCVVGSTGVVTADDVLGTVKTRLGVL